MGRQTKVFERFRYLLARALKKLSLSAVSASDIHPSSVIEGACQIVMVDMDRHSFCGYNCTILNATIGSFCSIADQVYIGGAGHPVHFVSTSPVFLAHRDSVRTKISAHHFENLPRTVIGNDVWIGFGARIRAGVNIGDGAVVGMGSVVTRDVAPYTIVAGNPARVINRRFNEEISQALIELKWWNMSDAELRENGDLFTSPEDLIRKFGTR